MLPRVSRATYASGGRVSAITGSARCRSDPGSQPATGSQCKRMPNTSPKNGRTTNDGMAIPTTASDMVA